MLNLLLNGSKDPLKLMRAREMKLKQPQNGIRLNPKPTLKSKKNRNKEKHMRRRHLQR
jgi:hypothetical protein